MKRIYTDGSSCGNPGPGGYGFIVFDETEQKCFHYEGVSELSNTTNNREELKAIIAAINFMQEKYPEEECIIFSDSAYCVNALNEWRFNWAANGWRTKKNEEVKNLDLFQTLDFLLRRHCRISIQKIGGHNGVVGNEIADGLATNNKEKVLKLMNGLSTV